MFLSLAAVCALFPACAAQTGGNGGGQTASESSQGGEGEENVVEKIVIEVNGAEFTATLAETDAARAVCDYLSSMSDRYAINVFKKLFVPREGSV